MTATTNEPKFKTISVRRAAGRNAEQAIAVLSLSGKKTSLIDWASDVVNRAALPILKKANIEPAVDGQ